MGSIFCSLVPPYCYIKEFCIPLRRVTKHFLKNILLAEEFFKRIHFLYFGPPLLLYKEILHSLNKNN